MPILRITDDIGEDALVMLHVVYSDTAFEGGPIGIKAGVSLGHNIAGMTWMPVFTEWWDDE